MTDSDDANSETLEEATLGIEDLLPRLAAVEAETAELSLDDALVDDHETASCIGRRPLEHWGLDANLFRQHDVEVPSSAAGVPLRPPEDANEAFLKIDSRRLLTRITTTDYSGDEGKPSLAFDDGPAQRLVDSPSLALVDELVNVEKGSLIECSGAEYASEEAYLDAASLGACWLDLVGFEAESSLETSPDKEEVFTEPPGGSEHGESDEDAKPVVRH